MTAHIACEEKNEEAKSNSLPWRMEPTPISSIKSDRVELKQIRQGVEATRRESQLQVSRKPARTADINCIRAQTANLKRMIVENQGQKGPLQHKIAIECKYRRGSKLAQDDWF